jgi:murein L,D-transpeptidase YcbB/YkuD
LIQTLERADADDLTASAYRPDLLERAVAGAGLQPASLARAELALSRAFAAYVGDLHRPPEQLAFVDPAVRLSPTDAGQILAQAARAPSMSAALAEAERMNPVYVALRGALAADRRQGLHGDAIQRLQINLERARALPPDLGPRYVFVDPAAETMAFVAPGEPERTMPVIVGKVSEPTPSLIGLIRYALFNPYWNVPPDLVRDGIAPKVLAGGIGVFDAAHYQALTDWSSSAAVLDPATIDWAAVATGREVLRVRQAPGPDNMMGQVKFMLPNPLGVYLHDTPLKGLFSAAARTDSSGCIRLKDAADLTLWLFGHPVGYDPSGPPDQRVDVTPPVPVYILYLTAEATPQGVVFPPDIYHRDPTALARLSRRF